MTPFLNIGLTSKSTRDYSYFDKWIELGGFVYFDFGENGKQILC